MRLAHAVVLCEGKGGGGGGGGEAGALRAVYATNQPTNLADSCCSQLKNQPTDNLSRRSAAASQPTNQPTLCCACRFLLQPTHPPTHPPTRPPTHPPTHPPTLCCMRMQIPAAAFTSHPVLPILQIPAAAFTSHPVLPTMQIPAAAFTSHPVLPTMQIPAVAFTSHPTHCCACRFLFQPTSQPHPLTLCCCCRSLLPPSPARHSATTSSRAPRASAMTRPPALWRGPSSMR